MSAESDAKDPAFLDAWAVKMMRHGELDLWLYLPDRGGAPPGEGA